MSYKTNQDCSADYWQLEIVVSTSFNRLKGKILNLIEASIPDKVQQEALKGLIKGFANDEYRNCQTDMQYYATLMKLIEKGETDEMPKTACPLDCIPA